MPRISSAVLSAATADFLESLYVQYTQGSQALSEDWVHYFKALEHTSNNAAANNGTQSDLQNGTTNGASPANGLDDEMEALAGEPLPHLGKQAAVFHLINAYRTFGHTIAHLDPLGQPHMVSPPDLSLAHFGLEESDLEQHFSTGALHCGVETASLRDIHTQLKATYCGSIGVEYMPIREHEKRRWLQKRMEPCWNIPSLDQDTRLQILTDLIHAERFEKFLHTQFVGQKRFSIEGGEAMVVMLNGLITQFAKHEGLEVVIGMPHRGRLNTLANVMKKGLELIFAEFDDTVSTTSANNGSGDVKYHQGYSQDVNYEGKKVHLSLTFNPSHLEVVNPVVEGNVRGKQQRSGDHSRKSIIPVLLHGDAAFAGQGLVMETLNLAYLEGYTTGGTIHIIVNNQIGFTTGPDDYRSTVYSSDACKMLNIPVIHVNGDDPEAVWHVMEMAVGYRQTFQSDIVIDLYCYRRLGHNESDEPSFTQPAMYERIQAHPSTLSLYCEKLQADKVLTHSRIQELITEYDNALTEALGKSRAEKTVSIPDSMSGAWQGITRDRTQGEHAVPGVDKTQLKHILGAIASYPTSFTPHPRLKRLIDARTECKNELRALDWGTAELLAYGSLVMEKYRVRLSGQDSCRGTFSHRHAKLVDSKTGKKYCALQNLSPDQGRFTAYDSPLSEAGVLGFEFGYSLSDPNCLTIWEAQFGDFANGAQVIIDQFISSSEAKWLRISGLVLLLPHGFEGQGPEHSSARLERFLQMCASDNMQVISPTTPAQFYHMMRRQQHSRFKNPLVVMTPKSLLRHPQAVSTLDELSAGKFEPVLADFSGPASKISRIVLCNGKVFYDLKAQRDKLEMKDIALIRIEQLYPFPAEALADRLQEFTSAQKLVWAQEEPQNMGSWTFVHPYLTEINHRELSLSYAGRIASAAPATGSHHIHDQEQAMLVSAALGQH